ncbi:CGNR zinc finger domain-containing protein [Actinoplanes sp. NPDC023801]|uniref:CGNR zinc finger domain-containing protein n=1 Tax=Actinoplanes sp. NPDC023801 TaxID=3154595 RepID=UPI00340E7905
MTDGNGRRSPLIAPPQAALVLDFVNTKADGGHDERLGDAADLERWLAGAGLIEPGTVVTAADAAAARELRDAVVTVLLAHSGEAGAELPAAESHLRRAAALHPLIPVISAGGLALVSGQAGVPAAFGSILAAVADIAATDRWGRLKACRNPPCHFGFFDRTRNGSATYCSPGCGSQVSMRALRRRRQSG